MSDDFEAAEKRLEQWEAERNEFEAKQKRRREFEKPLFETWSAIHESIPRDGLNFIDHQKTADWIKRFNRRIGNFIAEVKRAGLSEFLKFLPSFDDNGTVSVGLLNKPPNERLATMRKWTEGRPEVDWHLFFFDDWPLNRLLNWRRWKDSTNWEQRYEIYQQNCHRSQLMAIESGHPASAYRDCFEQHRRLMDDPERQPGRIPIKLDFHSLNEFVKWQSTQDPDADFDPVSDCKAAIWAYKLTRDSPYHLTQWMDANCPLDNVPPIDDPVFLGLVAKLKFQLELQPEQKNNFESTEEKKLFSDDSANLENKLLDKTPVWLTTAEQVANANPRLSLVKTWLEYRENDPKSDNCGDFLDAVETRLHDLRIAAIADGLLPKGGAVDSLFIDKICRRLIEIGHCTTMADASSIGIDDATELLNKKTGSKERVHRTTSKRAGRKPAKLTSEEKRIQKAWQSGAHKVYFDCDDALKLKHGTTKETIHRLRNRPSLLNERSK